MPIIPKYNDLTFGIKHIKLIIIKIYTDEGNQK
jgi:hypothetical protein